MLHFTFGEPAAFHLTLSELTTIEDPWYLFVFDRRVPGRTVSFNARPDESSDRSDSFVLDVDGLFQGAEVGQYAYRVFEQEGNEILDPTGLNEVEHGVMQLHPEINFAFIARAQTINYKTR